MSRQAERTGLKPRTVRQSHVLGQRDAILPGGAADSAEAQGERKHKPEKNLKWRDGTMGQAWYYDFKLKRKRFRGFAGYLRDPARIALAAARKEKFDELNGLCRRFEPVTFKDFADEWLKGYSKIEKRSWRRDEFSIAHLKAFFKDKRVSEVESSQVAAYKTQRLADSANPATINRELACLRSILYKAVEWGKLEAYPLPKRKLLLKEKNDRFRVLTDSEARRLIAKAKPHLRPVLVVLLNTGMRKTEALSLRWETVDFRRGLIHVGAADSKTGRPRDIPMNTAVYNTLRELEARRAGSEFVFVNPETKKALTDVKRSFHTACKEAEVKAVRLHDLRHTAASKMVECGFDLVTVKEILGHATIQMTMRYSHATPENARRAVEKLSEFFGEKGQKRDTVKIERRAIHLNRDN